MTPKMRILMFTGMFHATTRALPKYETPSSQHTQRGAKRRYIAHAYLLDKFTSKMGRPEKNQPATAASATTATNTAYMLVKKDGFYCCDEQLRVATEARSSSCSSSLHPSMRHRSASAMRRQMSAFLWSGMLASATVASCAEKTQPTTTKKGVWRRPRGEVSGRDGFYRTVEIRTGFTLHGGATRLQHNQNDNMRPHMYPHMIRLPSFIPTHLLPPSPSYRSLVVPSSRTVSHLHVLEQRAQRVAGAHEVIHGRLRAQSGETARWGNNGQRGIQMGGMGQFGRTDPAVRFSAG